MSTFFPSIFFLKIKSNLLFHISIFTDYRQYLLKIFNKLQFFNSTRMLVLTAFAGAVLKGFKGFPVIYAEENPAKKVNTKFSLLKKSFAFE